MLCILKQIYVWIHSQTPCPKFQNWPPERSFDRRPPPPLPHWASPEQLQRAVQRSPARSPLNETRSCWRLLAPSPDSNSLLPPEWMWRRTLSPPAYRKNLTTSQTGGALIIIKKSSNHFAHSKVFRLQRKENVELEEWRRIEEVFLSGWRWNVWISRREVGLQLGF